MFFCKINKIFCYYFLFNSDSTEQMDMTPPLLETISLPSEYSESSFQENVESCSTSLENHGWLWYKYFY